MSCASSVANRVNRFRLEQLCLPRHYIRQREIRVYSQESQFQKHAKSLPALTSLKRHLSNLEQALRSFFQLGCDCDWECWQKRGGTSVSIFRDAGAKRTLVSDKSVKDDGSQTLQQKDPESLPHCDNGMLHEKVLCLH